MGSACATLSISNAWFWYESTKLTRSQFNFQDWPVIARIRPAGRLRFFPITQVALSPIVNRSDLSQNPFYRNRNPDKV
jgi:hypothetical protein